MTDIIGWAAPTNEWLSELDQRTIEGDGRHRWIVDRFRETYLNLWATESLQLEWQYIHGEVMPPCPPKELTARPIDEGTLNEVIAERSVGGLKYRDAMPLNRFVVRAVDLLSENRRQEAAAIFEIVCEVQPKHAEAHNNLGFCLLPDRPLEALNALERAHHLNGFLHPTTLGNRVYALMALGRLTSALDLVDRHLGDLERLPAMSGWMWQIAGPKEETKLVEVGDMRAYVLDLAVEAARRSGNGTLEATWSARREQFNAD